MIKIIVNDTECVFKGEIEEGQNLNTNATKIGYQILEFDTDLEAELYITDNNLVRGYSLEDEDDIEIPEPTYPDYDIKIPISKYNDMERYACLTKNLEIDTLNKVITTKIYIEHPLNRELDRYVNIYARDTQVLEGMTESTYQYMLELMNTKTFIEAFSTGVHLADIDGTINKIYE